MATTRRPADLPDFERPPLNELVLSVQFASVPFQNFHSGLLWQRFANEYPRVEEQPPIEPVFETFGALQAREHRLTLQLMPMPATMRYWFVSPDGDELLQVQSDRLIHNSLLAKELSGFGNFARKFFTEGFVSRIATCPLLAAPDGVRSRSINVRSAT